MTRPKPLSYADACEMVLRAFNVQPGPTATVDEQVAVIISAALRMPWADWEIARRPLTRNQFAEMLASVRALFLHVMVPKGSAR